MILGFTIVISVIIISVGTGYAYALDYTYPTINQRLTEIPTYCAVESISNKIESSEMDEMIQKSEIAVNTWKQKLQNSEPTNKEFWDMKFKKISKNESVSEDCTITILFRDDPEFSGSLLSKTLGAFMRNTIFIYYENQESVYGDKWMDGILKTIMHEMGHTFGLGHYTTDDNDVNNKIATRDESPPSIMFAPAHINPDVRKITDLDVSQVRSIYGSYGFHAFSEQRPSEIIIENPTLPLDPEYPFEFTKISENTVKLFRHQDTLLKITGQVNNEIYMQGHHVFILITNPDLSTQVLKITPTRDGFFETFVNFNYKSLPIKNYKIVIKNSNSVIEPLYLNALNKIGLALIELRDYEKSLSYFEQVYEINPDYPDIEKNLENSKLLIFANGTPIEEKTELSVPGWIKSAAGWWISNQATDGVFIEALEYMQNKGMIGNYEFSNYSQSFVPGWIKQIVSWWVDGRVSDEEFLKTIDYLSEKGIIVI